MRRVREHGRVDGVNAMPHRLDALDVAVRESTRLARERRQFHDCTCATQVAAAWESTELVVMPYKDVKDLYILGDVSELIAALDESLVTVNTVLGSRYVGGIRNMVEGWRKDLILFQDTLDEWLACQRAWMCARGVPRYRGAFTPSTRLVSIRRGRGWSLFRF